MSCSVGDSGVDVVDPHRLVAMLPDLAPGKAAALLGDIDRRVLTGDELTVLIQTECRVQAWMQAGLAASMDELSHCPDSPMLQADDGRAARVPEPSRFAADEIALAASISSGTASWHLRRAAFIRHRMPAVWQAWRRGSLTQSKVFGCYEELNDCADAVIDEFIHTFFDDDVRGRDGLTAFERAVADTAGEFQDRARRLVARLDTDAMRRRHDRRVRGRRVVGQHDRDGVGYLSGTDLPVESVAAAYEHVDAIARAMKNNGDQRTLDALRADIYTDLLTGDGGHRRYDLFAEPDDDPAPDDEVVVEEPAADDPPVTDEPPEPPDPAAPPQPAGPAEPAEPTVSERPVHLVVPFDLLAGGDTPADVDGYGPMPADAGRGAIVWARRHRSTWALTVVDPATGRPIIHVRCRWRPRGSPAPSNPDQLVELLVPAEALEMTAADLDPRRLLPPRLLRKLLGLARHAPAGPCDGRHDRAAHDPTRGQRHFVQARDRHCCFPGCRRRAITCDVDHRLAWEAGGPTCVCNLHPLCRHHHQAKQHPGWLVTLDPATGNALWTSPHGCRAANDTHRLDPLLYLATTPVRPHQRGRPRTDPDAT